MQLRIDELMNKLGVGYVLGPYETFPWSCYDPTDERTCSAEVRMSADGKEVEAEIQIMPDVPEEGKPPMEQICLLRAAPAADGQWTTNMFKVRGETYGADIYDWQSKACEFFAAVISDLKLDQIPDFDDLLKKIFKNSRLADQEQGGGGKSPKVKAGQLLNMNKKGF